MKHYSVPFYPNPDDTHCYQASLRSVLKYFLPENEYTWEELDKLTGKKKDFWTWPTKAMIELHKMNFSVINKEAFNARAFIRHGKDYLTDTFGKEASELQAAKSDLRQEQNMYKQLLDANLYEQILPKIDDITNLLNKGHLVICNVNSKALNNQEGYMGHFVVVIGYDDKNVYFNDPGLPAQKNRKVSLEQFLKAWSYPDERARNLIGLKLEKN